MRDHLSEEQPLSCMLSLKLKKLTLYILLLNLKLFKNKVNILAELSFHRDRQYCSQEK